MNDGSRSRADAVELWRSILAAVPPLLDVPVDGSRLDARGRRRRSRWRVAPLHLREIATPSDADAVPVPIACLTAFVILMSKLVGEGAPTVALVFDQDARKAIGVGEDHADATMLTLAAPTIDLTVRALEAVLWEECRRAFDRAMATPGDLVDVVREAMPDRPAIQLAFGFGGSLDGDLERVAGVCDGLGAELGLWMLGRADALHAVLVYDERLFSDERVAEMLDQYVEAHAQVARNVTLQWRAVSIVTARARALHPDPAQPLTSAWPGAVHERFDQHAAMTPSSTAILAEGAAWTYAELRTWSDDTAATMMAHGIERRDVVAIYATRSARLVATILGVLKSAAAYLSLDPRYPPARLVEYLRIARPALWVNLVCDDDALPATLREAVTAVPLRLDVRDLGHGDGGDRATSETSRRPIAATDLACLSFTSGSTGAPKAVLGGHGSLSSFIPWQRATFQLGPSDRFSMLSGLAHDPLQRDMFTPLQVGAAICIPGVVDLADSDRLMEWLRRERVTVAHMTPGLLKLLTAKRRTDALPALRLAFVVGDTLMTTDVRDLERLAPHVQCVNLYGATETQRAVSHYIVPKGNAESEDRRRSRSPEPIPLGIGIPDVQLLVLTQDGQPAGTGELGEIWVRSLHLSQGYLDDPTLTRARFVRNPASHDPDDRLYRTGDLGRYRPDGHVEFAGRAEQQVKVRGYRVDLTEIESALTAHQDVQQAAVLARPDAAMGYRLAAYVVAKHASGSAALDRRLRDYLSERLPEFMVPSNFVIVPQMPLTPNGKLDRTALDRARAALARAADDLSSCASVDGALMRICQSFLSIADLRADDDLFERGADSLSAIRIVDEVSTSLGVDLSLSDVFSLRTVRNLSHRIARCNDESNRIDSGSSCGESHHACSAHRTRPQRQHSSIGLGDRRRKCIPGAGGGFPRCSAG